MAPDLAALVANLKVLRRGLGIQDPNISTKVGYALRQACGVVSDDPAGTVNNKVTSRLEQLIDRLPDTQRTLARTVFGYGGSADTNYTNRLRSLSPEHDRDVRTMQRRADSVVQRIAELMETDGTEAATRGEPPWHTTVLDVTLILDRPEVEVLETRRIVSHRAGLRDLELSMTVASLDGVTHPVELSQLGIDILRGGDVHSVHKISTNRVAFQLTPPRVLDARDEHEFLLRVRLPRMSPFFVCTPNYPCQRFDLRARFGKAGVPPRIWRIDGEFSMEANDPMPARKLVTADNSGEVHVGFDHLEPARSYGIGWQPMPS